MPFLLLFIRWKAMSHLFSGIWESSKMVPIRTVNCLRHLAQQYTPFLTGLFDPSFGVSAYAFSLPQRGHTGQPSGHLFDSMNLRAASSSANSGERVARLRVS